MYISTTSIEYGHTKSFVEGYFISMFRKRRFRAVIDPFREDAGDFEHVIVSELYVEKAKRCPLTVVPLENTSRAEWAVVQYLSRPPIINVKDRMVEFRNKDNELVFSPQPYDISPSGYAIGSKPMPYGLRFNFFNFNKSTLIERRILKAICEAHSGVLYY